MPRRPGGQADEVCLLGQAVQRVEPSGAFLRLAGRVVQQDFHAQVACHFGHQAAHMAHAHDAHGEACQRLVALHLQQEQGGVQVLGYGGGIAARRVGPLDACLAAVGRVYMVEADGGGSDEAHLAAFQQGAVAACAGADDQGIGVLHKFRRECVAGRVDHFVGDVFDGFADEGDFIIDYDFHTVVFLL